MTGWFSPFLFYLARCTENELRQQIEFLKAENEMLRKRVPKQRIFLKPEERRRLLKLGSAIGPDAAKLITIVSKRTYQRWVREKNYGKATKKMGRPRTQGSVREIIIRLARETAWGYSRILGELRKLRICGISRTTVKNILKEEGIKPSFKRLMTMSAGALLLASLSANAAETALAHVQEPTIRDVRYGDGPRHKLHFWRADSQWPTAVAVHIHGGGWNGGQRLNKNLVSVLPHLLEANISVVSVEYRLIRHAVDEGVDPPVKAPLLDCARALQFVRSKAEEWNIDPARVAVFGGSAGGCTSLWLAFHDDLADRSSEDPIVRQSTRPNFAAVLRAQTTLDPVQMKEWMPNGYYGGHAFGIINPGKENREKNIKAFLARRDELLPKINEYSPYALASRDDPPIYLYYKEKPAMGKNTRDPTHSSNYGVGLHDHLQLLGVQCELVYPGAPDITHASIEEYLVKNLQ